MRQVAHALLTRPPLSHITRHPEGIWDQASFDLHVLSTPPAFILSQDQTLMLNGLSQVKKALASYPCSLLFYKERSSVFSKNLPEKFIGIFKVVLLFSCQCPR